MGRDPSADVSYGSVDPPPCNRPLEVLERDDEWVVREYHRAEKTAANGVATYGTYDSRIDAMRDGKAAMERRRHPCLLRWDTPRSVGGLYWNPAFETLAVEYSPLLQSWVVTPRSGHFVFQAVDATKTAHQLGKLVLEQYDFRRVTFHSRNGDKQGEREHRFLRNDITDSGVRFKRGRLPTSVERPAPPPGERNSEGSTDEPTGQAVLHTLASAVPDITSLNPVDTDGVVYTYRTPWDDGTAHVWILNPEYTDHRTLRHAFDDAVEDWLALAEETSVTPVYETGGDPATWVLFDVSDTRLPDCRAALTTDQRLAVLSSLGEAMGAARRQEVYRTGLRPEQVRVDTTRVRDAAGPRSPPDRVDAAHVSGFGVRRRVGEALDRYGASRFMAPEQLRQAVTPTTPVYRLGAVAYWLLTGTDPFHDRQDFTTALRDGDLASPDELAVLPSEAAEAVRTATHTDPGERYGTPTEFVRKLLAAFA